MRTVLVGVDGSPTSVKAARMALTLAQRFEAKLVLLFASPPFVFPPSLPQQTIREAQLRESQSVQDTVQGVIADAEKGALRAEFIALSDVAPAEALVDAAERLDAWLVVVGDRGRHGVARVFLGSVADRVVHLCKRPVIVVK